MEHPQLHLHDQGYMDRLLKNESCGRVLQLLKYIDLKGDPDVVDFACGNGIVLEFLYQQVGDYYGVDFSPYAIENAKIRKKKLGATNAHFFCESIQSFCKKNLE